MACTFLVISGIKHLFHPLAGNLSVLLRKLLVQVPYHILNLIIWVRGIVLPLTYIGYLYFIIF